MRVTVYRLDLRGGLTSRGGIMNLLLGNGLGISTLALYAYFIYSAFIARPA